MKTPGRLSELPGIDASLSSAGPDDAPEDEVCTPTPYTLHPTPYTLHLASSAAPDDAPEDEVYPIQFRI